MYAKYILTNNLSIDLNGFVNDTGLWGILAATDIHPVIHCSHGKSQCVYDCVVCVCMMCACMWMPECVCACMWSYCVHACEDTFKLSDVYKYMWNENEVKKKQILAPMPWLTASHSHSQTFSKWLWHLTPDLEVTGSNPGVGSSPFYSLSLASDWWAQCVVSWRGSIVESGVVMRYNV